VKVRDGMTALVLTIGPAHTLREAARLMSARRAGAAMVKSGFRHLVVIEGGEVAGLLSMRDIVRVWAEAAAPVAQAQAAAPA
jgi:CBS domain-containing protein